MVDIRGAAVPERALESLIAFPGEHAVRQVVSEDLGFVATGWLDDDVMLGGASGSRARAEGQFHPATIHWRAPNHTVGWLRLLHAGPLDAVATERRLDVTVRDHPRRGPQPTIVESSHPGVFDARAWTFPGLTIRIEAALGTGGPAFNVAGDIAFSLTIE